MEDYVFWRRQPGLLTTNPCLGSTFEHLALEWHGPQQPEVHLERRTRVNGIELVGRPIRGTNGLFVDVIVASEQLSEAWHLRRGQLDDEVQIVSQARHTPGVAGHRAGEHVGEAAAVQPPQAVHEKLLFVHWPLANSILRWSKRSTSASSASGCCTRMPARAISQASSCSPSAILIRSSQVICR